MYHARQPTGEVIVDEVLDILRHYKLIYPEDVAVDVITHWRVLQAQDWLRKRLGELSNESLTKKDLVRLLKETAHRCGWKSEVVMSHVFKRYCGCTALDWLRSEQARSSEKF